MEEMQGNSLFLLTALLHIQINEGVGSGIMRDSMREKECREEESQPQNRGKARKRPLGERALLKINTVMRIHPECAE